jgi:GntR family transcriptional regulator/MocR family aminotransferase
MSHPLINDLALDFNQPLQTQLYRQLTGYIMEGRLPPGTQLPSSRQLAEDLGVSRNTVLAVYEQLKAEGVLQNRPGRGMFVHADLDAALRTLLKPVRHALAAPPRTPACPTPIKPGQVRQAHHHNNLPFTPGLPDLRAFPLKSWNRVLHHHENRHTLLGYDNAQGGLPLRRAIAEYLRTSRGVRCHEHQIIVTQGAQQALSLIADVMLNPGDTVLVENPGYRGARYALGRHHIKLTPIPLDRQVLSISSLPTHGNAKLLYCTPTHQYPLGGILDATQRLQLLQWARATGIWIIEDDYDSEFHFYTKPFAALQGMHDTTPVFYA